MKLRMVMVVSAVVAAVSSGPSWAQFVPNQAIPRQRAAGAQRYLPGAQRNIAPQPFSGEGTIMAVRPGLIQVMTSHGQAWLIAVPRQASVAVTGTVDAQWLRAGVHVRFDGDIDRGVVKEKVDRLTVVSSMESGIWPQGEAPGGDGEKPAVGERKFGGLDNDGGNAADGAEGAKAKRSAATKSAGKGSASGPVTVIGAIAGVRKGKMTINAGRTVVKAELADEVTVDVRTDNYMLARQGDKISIVEGRTFPGMMGRAQATKLTIELAGATGLEKPKADKPVRPATKRAGKAEARETEPLEGQAERSDEDEPKR